MKEIFTDLYKKVLGFFQNAPEQDTENAKDVARNRLKLVLMQDRTNLTPYLLERMRGEMIEVLSKYVEMDKDELELNFEIIKDLGIKKIKINSGIETKISTLKIDKKEL